MATTETLLDDFESPDSCVADSQQVSKTRTARGAPLKVRLEDRPSVLPGPNRKRGGGGDSDVALGSQRAGQGGGYFAKTAHFHIVGKLGSDEQDLGPAAWNGIGAVRRHASGFGWPRTSSEILRLPPLSRDAKPTTQQTVDPRTSYRPWRRFASFCFLKRCHVILQIFTLLTAGFCFRSNIFC